MNPKSLKKQELINWAKEVRAACVAENDTVAVSAIDAAIDAYEADKFVFSVMGLAKRGKSTLVNALLGRSDDMLAPIDFLPATSVCTTFGYASKERIEVVDRNGNVKQISAEEIRDYATEEGNPGNCKEVQLIRVESPFSEKFKGVTLVDLPGAGSIHEHHDQIIYQFIPQSDAVLLLTTARMPISADEIDLLKEVQKNDIGKIFVAMNKIDITDVDELSVGEEANRKKLSAVNVAAGTIYKISAKRAFEGNLEDSGVPDLMDAITDFVDKNRGTIVKERFVAKVKAAAISTARAVEMESTISDLPSEKLAEVEKELAIKKKEFEETNRLRSKDFKLRWDGIIDEFESSLPQVKSAVQVELTSQMESYGIATVGKFKKDIPGFFAKTMEAELANVSQYMERRLRDLTKKYEEECPCIYISSDGTVSGSQDVSRTSEAILAGTGTTLAVGGGLFATVASGLTTTMLTPLGASGAYLATNLAGATTTIGAASVGVSLAEYGGVSLATPAVTSGIGEALLGSAGAAAANAGTYTVPTFLATVANPIGWTIAGVGALALGCAWGLKRYKDLKKLKKAVEEKTEEVFSDVRNKQLPALREMGDRIVTELESVWALQLVSMETTMKKVVRKNYDSDLCSRSARFSNLLNAI